MLHEDLERDVVGRNDLARVNVGAVVCDARVEFANEEARLGVGSLLLGNCLRKKEFPRPILYAVLKGNLGCFFTHGRALLSSRLVP